MILLINICKEEMHYLEFVQPIIDIVKETQTLYIVKHYTQLTDAIIDAAEKIIICGTSLHDFAYLNNLDAFDFLQQDDFNKPVLAICGGMQILALQFGCKLDDGQEIGLQSVLFEKEFLGIQGIREVYCLHKKIIVEDVVFKKNFIVSARTDCVQAITHKEKPFYGTLFHPEVRNKELMKNFLIAHHTR
ncbi:MAG: hypothetical protein WC916_00780 [Candidatus Woesearchaeota archaeon]